MLGIEPLTPDNTDLNDLNVWKSIRDDTTLIFQWESLSAQKYMKEFMSDRTLSIIKSKSKNFSMLKWMSFGNGLLRPACASFRDSVAKGEMYDNGFEDLNEFLAPEAGRIAMQETIMQFLVKFCGYSGAESDTVRRCLDEDSVIKLADGTSKRIADISVGDRVVSFNDSGDSEPQKVNHVFDNGIQECFEIKAMYGYSLIGTASHKILTQDDGYKKIGDLTVGDYIAILNNNFRYYIRVTDIKPVGKRHVYDLEVAKNHNYVADGIIVHNCIAKKKGTETLLPEIEQRFINYSSRHYDITPERCKKVIKPFLQIILDASEYSFSWNHSDAYSCIGYICGYLRYYYPLEFLTAAFNMFEDMAEKTTEITSYASKVGIKVVLPKWGYAKGSYFYDKESNTISKGLHSVKYIGTLLPDELYNISHERKYKYFLDVLHSVLSETSIDKKQLDILIKIDFFSEFGNQRELLRLTDLFFNIFVKKNGKGKLVDKIKKEKVQDTFLSEIVPKYSSGKTKAGKDATNYTVWDIISVMHETEEKIMSLGLPDLDDIIKIQNFYEATGYVGYASKKESDRSKLYILDVWPLTRKKDGVQFGYSIHTVSVGSGKESKLTVPNRTYDEDPINPGDIIRCIDFSRNGQYFRLVKYRHEHYNDINTKD